MFTGKARAVGVTSEDFSILFRLNRSDFIQVLKNSPNEYVKIIHRSHNIINNVF